MLKRDLSYDTGFLSISEYTTCSMQTTTTKNNRKKKCWKSYNKHLVREHIMCRPSNTVGLVICTTTSPHGTTCPQAFSQDTF